ncbi:MAG: hypothetical protein J3K34DRAFT_524027 [Monoraphidium minutum]|nr:MAG: hypothetical protein J3K34DRAFT_524027 [Monoraphidium minutum]
MGAHTAAAAEVEEHNVPTVEDWSEKDSKIVVRTEPGANVLADLILRSKVPASPDEVYAVLKHPDSHAIFRGIKATVERRTIEDDGRGRRTLFVHHQAATRFLWLQVTFSTQLLVEEDDRARTICFKNAKDGGFMRVFTGRWEVSPFCQETLNRMYAPEEQQPRRGWLHPARALGAMQHRMSEGGGRAARREASLVTLEQVLAPRILPPGPLMRMVRGLCARTVINMMTDLKAEIARREEAAAGGAPAAVGAGKGGKRDGGKAPKHAASMSLGALDLFCSAAPLQITIDL